MTTIRESLDRHRDDPVPQLQFSVPVDRLMDDPYLNTLTADLHRAAPSGFERLAATKKCGAMIPDKPGVYFFVWSPSVALKSATHKKDLSIRFVLYVGKAGGAGSSGTLRSRFNNEYRKFVGGPTDNLWADVGSGRREDRLRKWLALQPLDYWYTVVEDNSMVESLESRLIDLLNPPLNAQTGPRLRRGATREAF